MNLLRRVDVSMGLCTCTIVLPRRSTIRPGPRWGSRPVGLRPFAFLFSLGASAFLTSGCRDDVAAPTQGFIEVSWTEATQVEVLVDGEVIGTDQSEVGPLDAGTYVVSVRRNGYLASPTERTVQVSPAKRVPAAFTLQQVEFGSVQMSAVDELTGAAVSGAQILRETSPGNFVDSGQTTPVLLEGLPPGNIRFQLAKSGFVPSEPFDVEVVLGEEVAASALLGPPRGVLFEMFTYSTCPNCPFASDSLRSLREDFPSQVHVVEWHSGASAPPFVLYQARWKTRETYYTGGSPIGYPATSFAGETELLVGGQVSDLSLYRPKAVEFLAACDNDCPVAMRLEGNITLAGADLTARVKWRGGSLPGNLRIRFVLLEDHVIVAGNEPDGFDFVSREVDDQPLTFALPGETLTFNTSLPVQSWPGTNADPLPYLSAVAFVQSDDSKAILTASGLP